MQILIPLIPFVPWVIIYDSHGKCKPDIYKWQTKRPKHLLHLDLWHHIILLTEFQHNQETFRKQHQLLKLYAVKHTYETIIQFQSKARVSYLLILSDYQSLFSSSTVFKLGSKNILVSQSSTELLKYLILSTHMFAR